MKKLASATGKIVEILEPLEEQERGKVINAAMMLLGEGPVMTASRPTPSRSHAVQEEVPLSRAASTVSPQDFFEDKDPHSKMEELSVAARYLELHQALEEYQKEDIENVFREARRNFDSSNFTGDLRNAKNRGFFNKSVGRNRVQLSYYGQQFVDALPDRSAAKKVRQPSRRTSRRQKGSGEAED